MILLDEDPKTVVSLATILATRRAGSTVVVVFDNDQRVRRLADMDYILGEKGLLMAVHDAAPELKPTFSQSDRELRIDNGSRVMFAAIGHESDVAKFMGTEIDMLSFDRSSVIPASVMKQIGYRVRSGLTVRDVVALKDQPIATGGRRRMM